MPRLRGFSLVVLVLAAVVALTGAAAAQDTAPRVLSVILENDINPVTADYVVGAIERGEREGYDAVVIQLDTPGGLDSAMREIIKKELSADVPVVVYVAPSGSRAASAGAFITLAADVAAMAPGTNIGSSTPIAVGGGEIPTDLRRKVVNDAAAYARDLAELHGRNGDWAEQAVRQASNLGSQEALEQNVVDVVAPDLPTLLNEIDGMTVEPKGITLNTAGAAVDEIEMSLWKRVLDTLIDPNLIVLLMSIGVLGITIEILNPGLILPGTVGVISLIIGLFGLQVLPVSWAGLLLMGLAAGFFVAEAFVPSHGALALAGAVSFVIGALMLFDPAGEGYQVSIWVALAVGRHARARHRHRRHEGHPSTARTDEDRPRGDGRRDRRRPQRARAGRPRQRPRRDLEGAHGRRAARPGRVRSRGRRRRGPRARRLAGRGARSGRRPLVGCP